MLPNGKLLWAQIMLCNFSQEHVNNLSNVHRAGQKFTPNLCEHEKTQYDRSELHKMGNTKHMGGPKAAKQGLQIGLCCN